MNKTRKIALALLSVSAAWPGLIAQTTPPPAPAAKDTSDEELVVLTPFEISTSKDTGYQATQTLAGTRIRTDLKDVGSAISVITKDFMTDIGATGSSTLLQYTTNAEVAGTRGTYAGLGNGTSLDETGSLRNPSSANRVRGLASADATRDFFVTDIPWDGYNVDRIDIQRGANSILFGLGSPAGIVNASTHNADFRNYGEVSARTGSYGSMRGSIDINQQLLPGVLAIRVDSLVNDQKFEQKPAFENDKRLYGALRFDPKLFGPSFHTSIKAKFEHGDINANRPRLIPPYDSVTPWFRADAATPAERDFNSGLGKLAVPNGYVLGSSSSTYHPYLGGYIGQQQPAWFIDGASNQLYRIYGGYVNTGVLNSAGALQGAGTNLIGQKYSDTFSDIASFSSYATAAKLPNWQYGQYKDRVITDSSVYDFYHNLIDGPNKSEFEKWNAYNLDFSQTALDDRVGVELSYDRQKYKRGGQQLLGNSPTINIDLLQNFQDYVVGQTNADNKNVANPNYGRPFVPAGPGNGSSYYSDRKYSRGSLYGELRASDFLDSKSFLAKLLGKHRFNGVYSDEQYYTENRNWQMYANSEAYAALKLQGAPDGIINITPIAVVYLGSTLKNATTATNAHIAGITSNVTLQDGNIYQFDATWRAPNGVNVGDPWNVPTNLQSIFNGAPVINTSVTPNAPYAQLTQASNPANYVGWNNNFQDTLLRYDNGADQSLVTVAAKSLRETKSYAGSWQGFMWNEAFVPTLGWRYDEVQSKSVSALPQSGGTARGALNLDPNVYRLPDNFLPSQTYKNHSTAGGLVVHLNKILGQHDFLPINVSVSYNKSNNFQVTDARRDIFGNSIANPTGTTKDYGITLSTKDDKYSLRVVKYESASSGSTISGFDNSGITNTIKDAMNWKNIKTYYMSAYAWSSAGQTNLTHYTGQRYLWDAAYIDNTTGRPVAGGQTTAANVPANSHLESQAEADTRRDASIDALNQMEVYLSGKGFFKAWNYGVGPTTLSALQTPGQYLASPILPDTASVYDYRTAPPMQGFAVTSNTVSKGYEYEFVANPLPNWRVLFNASQTTAVRSNIGGAALDQLVTYMDGVMAGPGGDLVRFNSDYSAANELRNDWNPWRGKYTLLKLQEGAKSPELREWRYNFVTNYSFTHGFVKGFSVGAGYRWQDKVVIGYPVIPDPVNPALASFDLKKPYYGPSEDAIDLWLGYERKLTDKVNWKIQLNVYNVGKKDKLIPISVEPDGHTWASARISPTQEWQLTNTFSF